MGARFVYLIFSHTRPEQLERLISAIRQCSPHAQVVVHHDASMPELVLASREHVHRVPEPVPVEWGEYSQVTMLLHALDWIEQNLDYDWVMTISGQDYPVQSLQEFEARLAGSGQDAFFRYFDIDDPRHWPNHIGRRRYYFRYFKLPRLKYYYLLYEPLRKSLYDVKVWFNKAQPLLRIQTSRGRIRSKLGFRRMKTPFGTHFKCYGGWDWFNLSRASIVYLRAYIEANPEIVAYYKDTFLPSESLVHTLLVNSKRIKVCNDACRFVNWKGRKHAASPAVITSEDLDRVLESGQLLRESSI